MGKYTLQVLISCMRQKDTSIIERSNIQSDVIVINQCDKSDVDKFIYKNKNGLSCLTKFISTTERGLSKSRNMAIENATADICLICDDDEILDDDYPVKILSAFEENPTADVIAFQIADAGKKYPAKKKKIGYVGALKLASWQLAFRRENIIEKGIRFDETLGSGVSKAGGEENMFVYDCLRKGLKVIFVPITIGRMIESESQWFHGFTPECFFDHGVKTRKLMGRFFASIYAIHFILSKHNAYSKELSLKKVTINIYKGIFSK